MPTQTALRSFRRDVRIAVEDITCPAKNCSVILGEIGRKFGTKVEEGITLGYASGFEACREQAIAQVTMRCNEHNVPIETQHFLVTTLAALEKGELP